MLDILASRLSPEERQTATDDLNFLFPTRSDKPHQIPRFRIVPPDEISTTSALPAITPLALHQFRLKNLNASLFDFPSHGLMNLHLYLQEICFSGFDANTREELRNLVCQMGGICPRKFRTSTHFLVAKDYSSLRCQWARDHNIPVLGKQWLQRLFMSPDLLDISEYLLNSKLASLKFTASAFSEQETTQLIELVKLNGGIMTRSLLSNSHILIVPEHSKITARIRKAVQLGISITTPQHLHEFLDGRSDNLEFVLDPLILSDLFKGQSFVLDQHCKGFRGLRCEIEQNGGTISDEEEGTYLISCSCAVHSPANRTPIWVERCIDEGKILDADAFPLYVPPVGPLVRLEGVDVSVTGFKKSDRLDIISGIKWLGMTYRSELTRKSRFLIANCESSLKIDAALKWGICVVGHEWLFALANGNSLDECARFIVRDIPPPVIPPEEPSKIRKFLSDDEDSLPSEIMAQIESQIIEDSHPTDGERENAEPVVQTSLNVRPQGSYRTSFLSDSSDSECVQEVVESHTAPVERSIEDISKKLRSYQKPKRSRRRVMPEHSALEGLGTFTQRPVISDDDEPMVVVGYAQESRKFVANNLQEDPLLQLMKDSDSHEGSLV